MGKQLIEASHYLGPLRLQVTPLDFGSLNQPALTRILRQESSGVAPKEVSVHNSHIRNQTNSMHLIIRWCDCLSSPGCHPTYIKDR
ncbi:MAG: hypothetical protein ACI87E_004379, partial [Mariniblastus sp.]